jgi:hypothetical protein
VCLYGWTGIAITLAIGLSSQPAFADEILPHPADRILLSSSFPSLNTADTAATAAHAEIYLNSNFTLSSNTVLRATWIGQGGIITLGNYNLDVSNFAAAPTLPSFHQNGKGRVMITRKVCASPQWWDADPTDHADSTAAFNDAVISTGSACVPPGQYNIAGSITIQNGQSMIVDPTAVLHRHTAGATLPMIYVLYVGSAGGASMSTNYSGGQIVDNADSPNGVVVLGHKNDDDTHNAWWWRFTDVSISANSNAGDITILVPSGQLKHGSIANYFGTISNVNIAGGDICMLLSEYANAHNINNIQFWNCATYALELRGAYGNNITNFFIHTGYKKGLIGVALKDSKSNSFSTTKNSISNFTDESGGSTDATLFVDSNAFSNFIQGSQNTVRTGTILNQNNMIILNGGIDQSVHRGG